jgi:ABC-2 type transport system permease protein
MLRGLLKLTWLETKIFLREPMGAAGTIAIPVVMFIGLGRVAGRALPPASIGGVGLLRVGLPVFAAILIALSTVISLATIIAIYREGGILKRLRATPLRPPTILTAHVIVKLMLTAVTLALMMLAGKRYYPAGVTVSVVSVTLALLVATWSILSMGFVIASIVPTARFAQPVAAAILYPMIAVSGLFFPIEAMPPAMRALARVTPLTYAVSLLKGVWQGDPWSAHAGDVAALVLVFVVSVVLSARFFRWE